MSWKDGFLGDLAAAIIGDRLAMKFFGKSVANATHAGGTPAPATPGAIHSSAFGFTNAEEFLSLDAFTLAYQEIKKKKYDAVRDQLRASLKRIAKLMASLPLDKRHKLACVLGYESTVPAPPPAPAPAPAGKKKGAPAPAPKPAPQTRNNQKGAEFLLMLCELSNSEIRDVLRATGSTDTLEDLLAHLWARGKSILAKASPYIAALDAAVADGSDVEKAITAQQTKAQIWLAKQKKRAGR